MKLKANISDCCVFGVNVKLGKKLLLPEKISVFNKKNENFCNTYF